MDLACASIFLAVAMAGAVLSPIIPITFLPNSLCGALIVAIVGISLKFVALPCPFPRFLAGRTGAETLLRDMRQGLEAKATVGTDPVHRCDSMRAVRATMPLQPGLLDIRFSKPDDQCQEKAGDLGTGTCHF